MRAVVIGGGVTGLTTAYRLLEMSRESHRSMEVVLLEAGKRLGGVIRTELRDGFLLEAGPDSFLTDKPWTLDLCRRLGLVNEVISTNPDCRRSFVVREGKLAPYPQGFSVLGPSSVRSFIVSPLLSWKGKFRALLDLVIPKRTEDSDESVAAFVSRRFGQEVYERLAEPMVRGVASGDPGALSMQALFPRFLEMERQTGSIIRALKNARGRNVKKEGRALQGARYGLFASFRGGMHQLVQALAQQLPHEVIRHSTRAVSVQKEPGGKWMIRLADKRLLTADAVCLAVPAFRASDLIRDTDASLAGQLTDIPFSSWVTVNIAFRKTQIRASMDGFGFVVPTTERMPITGCTFSHVKFLGRAPEGKVLLRAFLKSGDLPGELKASDEDVRDTVLSSVRPLLGIEGEALFTLIHRFREALPFYRVGHIERVHRIQERLRSHAGLALAGNAYTGHGITRCIRSGEEAAEKLFKEMMP